MTNGTNGIHGDVPSKEEALLAASIVQVQARRAGGTLASIPAAALGSTSPEAGSQGHHSKVPDVYRGICQVAKAISAEGIAKDNRNQQQGYSFRGIDAIYNALSALLAGAELCILPRMVSRSQEERTTAKGGVLFYVVVHADFDFVSCRDGSRHTVTMYGEAMDSADKATNKAMSAAYKYACLQVFCIPTEGMVDADATTQKVVPALKPVAVPSPRPAEVETLRRIPSWATSIAKIKEAFAEIQTRMPAKAYFEILNARGVDSPAQFKSPAAAWECYQILEAWIEAAKNPTTFQNFEATEGEWQ